MKILLIDDLRQIDIVVGSQLDTLGWTAIVARTFEDGIEALLKDGPFDVLYLDHDLGDPSPWKTGYDIMCFLEVNPDLLPGRIELVTSNPVGRAKMQVVIDKLYGGK